VKAIQISRTGGSDVLETVEVPTPKPGAGEVLVEAEAIGVNYFDLLIRTGRYRWMPKLPFILGNEMSGRVAAVGAGVRALHVGQPVFIAGYEIGNRGGLYAEYAAVPENAAFLLPASVDLDEATALTNYQLAWILLHHAARGVTPKTVVVYGAAGGVCSIDDKRREAKTISMRVTCKFKSGAVLASSINFTMRDEKTVDMAQQDGSFKAVLNRCPQPN